MTKTFLVLLVHSDGYIGAQAVVLFHEFDTVVLKNNKVFRAYL